MGPTSCLTESMRKPILKLLGVRQQWVSPRGPAHWFPGPPRGPRASNTHSLTRASSPRLLPAAAVAAGFVRVSMICRPGRSQNLTFHTNFRKTTGKLSTLYLMCFRTQKCHTSLRILPHEGARSIEQMYSWQVYDSPRIQQGWQKVSVSHIQLGKTWGGNHC